MKKPLIRILLVEDDEDDYFLTRELLDEITALITNCIGRLVIQRVN